MGRDDLEFLTGVVVEPPAVWFWTAEDDADEGAATTGVLMLLREFVGFVLVVTILVRSLGVVEVCSEEAIPGGGAVERRDTVEVEERLLPQTSWLASRDCWTIDSLLFCC